MHKIVFPKEEYSYSEESKSYSFLGEDVVGVFELLWSAVKKSPEGMYDKNGQLIGKKLDKKDRKIIKSINSKLKSISIYKDEDKDSRILNPERLAWELWLENQEYDMMIRLIEANTFNNEVNDIVATLWEIIDESEETELKPSLTKDVSASTDSE